MELDENKTSLDYYNLLNKNNEKLKKEPTEKIKNINNNITDIEEQVLEFWNKNNIFEKSINLNEEKFKFFDGPPFATGDPHYGHILVANIKDTICRFQTVANNKSIPRVAGWDCHGLPIEYEIEKKLGIKTKEQVLEFGIDNYNKECKNVVMKCEDNWKKTIGKNWKMGLILITVIKQWIQIIWKKYGGFLNNYMIKN